MQMTRVPKNSLTFPEVVFLKAWNLSENVENCVFPICSKHYLCKNPYF